MLTQGKEEDFRRQEQAEADRLDAFRVVAGTEEGRVVLVSILRSLGFAAMVSVDTEVASAHNAAHEIFYDIADASPKDAEEILRRCFLDEDC